jgi:hypothetical protein
MLGRIGIGFDMSVTGMAVIVPTPANESRTAFNTLAKLAGGQQTRQKLGIGVVHWRGCQENFLTMNSIMDGNKTVAILAT